MDHYFKPSYQQINHSKQDKQQSEKNNLPDLQEDHIVVLDDILFELILMQFENLLNKNLILSKCYRVRKKVQDQMCLLISNNWWIREMNEERKWREREGEEEE
ncbi:hypothetical protein C1646_755038 [Rhizophagus diaphanus]|nr:hypothetical protein C1646_755038 [Rhizophagus diaphanus] [Rhizophagus sp. MUCL 43196]